MNGPNVAGTAGNAMQSFRTSSGLLLTGTSLLHICRVLFSFHSHAATAPSHALSDSHPSPRYTHLFTRSTEMDNLISVTPGPSPLPAAPCCGHEVTWAIPSPTAQAPGYLSSHKQGHCHFFSFPTTPSTVHLQVPSPVSCLSPKSQLNQTDSLLAGGMTN